MTISNDSDYVKRLIVNNESLKNVNKEIIKNEQINQQELQNALKNLKETRAELDRVCKSYEELKSYKSQLERSVAQSRNELMSAQNELSKEKESQKDANKRTELLSNQVSQLMAEVENLKGNCKALKREKEVLMATYCRVMKENDKLRQAPDNGQVGNEEVESLRRQCKEWEVQTYSIFISILGASKICIQSS